MLKPNAIDNKSLSNKLTGSTWDAIVKSTKRKKAKRKNVKRGR